MNIQISCEHKEATEYLW